MKAVKPGKENNRAAPWLRDGGLSWRNYREISKIQSVEL